jgi:hypothetical protein
MSILERRGSEIINPLNGPSAKLEKTFAYSNIWERSPRYTEDAKGKLIREDRGKLKGELMPFLRTSTKGRLFVFVPAELAYEEDKPSLDAIKLEAEKIGTNGFSTCMYTENLERDDRKYTLSCSEEGSLLFGLDFPGRQFRGVACGEEHANLIAGERVDMFFDYPSGLIADEGDDWDFEYPPIFITAQKNSEASFS